MLKMKQDYNMKMSYKEDLIKSKDSRLKRLQENQKRMNKEKDMLNKILASKEVEVLSMIDVLQGSERVNKDNKNL